MKSGISILLLLSGAAMITACSAGREIQVDLVNAELVKIDTVFRHPGQEKVLTFRCENKMEMVSFVPMDTQYQVGTMYQVLMRK